MILVTGAAGQLGGDVCNVLKRNKKAFIPTDADTLDITDEMAVRAFFESNSISAVIHCAAYTAVDKAEDEREKCFLVNETGSRNLALCAQTMFSAATGNPLLKRMIRKGLSTSTVKAS